MKSNICFPDHRLKVGDCVIDNGRWYDFTYFIPDVLTNERKDKLKRLLK